MAEFKIDDKWIAEHKPVYQEQFSKMSYQERLDLYKNNRQLYDSLASSEKMKHPAYNHSEKLQALMNNAQSSDKVLIIK